MNTVSVIIPNFNRADIIGETIENMLSQSLPPHQVIVIDDGSTDNSLNVIRHFGNRVTLLQQQNKGPGAARNAGLQIATGEFIQFMDSDDLASLNKLYIQAEALIKSGADIVYGPWVKVWKKSNFIQLENVVLQQAPLPQSHSPLCWFLNNWSMVFQQCLVRRALVQRVGGYREDLRSLEDGDLFVRLLLTGGKLIYECDSLTFYRLDDYGKLTASGQQQERRIADEASFYKTIITSAEKNPVLQPCIRQMGFRLKVWNVLQELERTHTVNTDQFKHLYHLTENSNPINYLQNWAKTKKAGIQQRLKGHRWPQSYRAGALNSHQKKLIEELGWQYN